MPEEGSRIKNFTTKLYLFTLVNYKNREKRKTRQYFFSIGVVPLVIDNVILCREFEVEGEHDEACLAVLNNFYADGVVWHDIACYHEKFFVCEDSDDLLDFARQSSPPVLANRI